MPVLPVMSRLCPSQIFRLRSLISGMSEEGAEMETRSSRKAVSAGSVAGRPEALGYRREGSEGRQCEYYAGRYFTGDTPSALGVLR